MENKSVGSNKKSPKSLVIVLVIVVVLIGVAAGLTYFGSKATGELLSMNLSEPLNDATSAKITIDPDDGNLWLGKNPNSEQTLATGTLQYFENNGAPFTSVNTSNGNANFTLTANGGQKWLELPWSACNGATHWSVLLNSSVAYEISVRTGGGSIEIDLTGLTVTHLDAETGGGNMEITLPQNTENLDVSAKTGAGKVTINIGSGIKGRNTITASSGAGEMNVVIPKDVSARIKITEGNVIADSELIMIDESSYETPGFQNAADTVDITVGSGAGKVNIIIK